LGKNLKLFKEQIEHSGHVTLEDLVLGSMKEVANGSTQGEGPDGAGKQIEGPSADRVLAIGQDGVVS
jgi:hypothetical protein